MGRNHRRKQAGGKGKFNRDAPYDQSRQDGDGGYKTYAAVDLNNEAFEEYYRAQGTLSDEEWVPFLASLRSELPMTFRVTGSRAHAEAINDIIKTKYMPTMQDVELDGVKYDPPKQLEWYPGALAWHMAAPKRVIRKALPFKSFQRFLVGETEVGNLSRQEAVSMIPPLFLDVEPHHRCLDMCAAPGSKTAQIIEALNPHHTVSTGVLIANDSDYKRTHMLVHQTGRMPSRGLMVTNFDASMFPNISLGDGETLQFDRILADVPCSGDGTLRKNSDIWKKWVVADGNSLHSLQLRILERAMNILKPGGRLVYSTCSFNPVENEAVIAGALNSIPGFKLVDVSDHLPLLRRRPGMTSWKIATQPESSDRKLVYHDSYEAYRAAVEEGKERDKDRGKGLGKTCWPPANAGELGLEKCMRLVPHDQDTGGFFVCVLEKASTVHTKPVEPVLSAPEESSTTATEALVAESLTSLKRQASPKEDEPTKKPRTMVPKKVKRDLGFKEDPFAFVNEANEEVGKIFEWFQLDSTFPRANLLVRNEYGEPLRTMYLTNDLVKKIIQNNDYSRIRLISAGVKAFVRQDSQNRTEIICKWRIPSEGILEVLPYIKEGVVINATLEELKVFIVGQYPPIDKFPETFQKILNAAEFGNLLVKFEAGEMVGGSLPLPLYLPVWKAKTSMSLLINKREKSSLSLRTFGEDLTPKEVFKKTEDVPIVQAVEGGGEIVEEPVVEGSVVLVGEEAAIEEELLNQ